MSTVPKSLNSFNPAYQAHSYIAGLSYQAKILSLDSVALYIAEEAVFKLQLSYSDRVST